MSTLSNDDLIARILVSSQYGPGVVALWLLSFISVIISWTIHRDYRSRDSLDLDLLAAVAYPSVASADAISQIIHYPRDFSSFDDPNLAETQYLRALQAPLSICYLFFDFSPVLFLIAHNAFRRQMRRQDQILATLPQDAPLKRVLVIAIAWCSCAVARIFRFTSLIRFGIPEETESLDSLYLHVILPKISLTELADVPLFMEALVHCFFASYTLIQIIASGATILNTVHLLCCRYFGWLVKDRSLIPNMIFKMLLPDLSILRIVSGLCFFYFWTCFFMLPGLSLFRPFRLSGNSLSDLDQAFALFGGCTVFLFWLWEAFKSRKQRAISTREL